MGRLSHYHKYDPNANINQ